MNHDLQSQLQAFAAQVEGQPGPVQQVFQYCLALAMVEMGKAELVKTEPGEAGPVCTFRTVAGDVLAVLKPPLDEEQEAGIKEKIKQILSKEGGL